jgi:hypothetical protein
MKRTHRRAGRRLISLLVCLLGLPAAADDNTFDFEMILFERPGSTEAVLTPEEVGQPERALAGDRLDRQPEVARVLDAAAVTLRRRGMTVHEHLAWRMSPSTRANDTWYWIGDGRLEGLVQVSRGRFLHLDVDLLLRPVDGSGPFRVRLNRRMRSGELHYLDHPRVGILVQAERYRPEPEPAPAEDAPVGEPKPTPPVGTAPPAAN